MVGWRGVIVLVTCRLTPRELTVTISSFRARLSETNFSTSSGLKLPSPSVSIRSKRALPAS
jgi:hypothetical protein